MKITKTQLMKIIQETIHQQLSEAPRSKEELLKKVASGLAAGSFQGIGDKTLISALTYLPEKELKKLRNAAKKAEWAVWEAQKNARQEKEIRANSIFNNPKAAASAIQKSLKSRDWDWFWNLDYEQQDVFSNKISEWLGSGRGYDFTDNLTYYEGDSDVYRKMDDEEADATWEQAAKGLKKIVTDLKKI